jgi:hypothetical protein
MSIENDYPRHDGESYEDYKCRINREYEIDHKYGISSEQRRCRAERESFNDHSLWDQFLDEPIETLKK